jgi:carboxyl-terminal processing protease
MYSNKSKIAKSSTVLLLMFLLASFIFYNRLDAENANKNEVLVRAVMQGLNTAHFKPERVDDAFSKKVFDLYLKRLDYNKRFFTQADIAEFRKYERQLDNQIQDGSFEFLNLSMNLFTERLNETEQIYKDILSKPFDFTLEERIETDPDKIEYAPSKDALREEWRKHLKYQTLIRLNDKLDEQEASAKTSKDGNKNPKSMATLEEEARQKVAEMNDQLFRRMKQMDQEDRLTLYMNAIANAYDPHTTYMSPKEKASFDIAMTGRLEGIGATLQEKDGYIKVQEIVPGSPSARQGELKAGDIIMKVSQGNLEPVDLAGMRLDNAVQLIRGKKGTVVRLTVRKLDGSIRVIPITRDVVVIEETYAQSAVIDGPNNRKVGYIKLPTFYADFSGRGGRSSGADVKKELAKLNQEKVEGVILDLRNNGGGSLQDVVEMAGLFIKSGPIVQVGTSGGAPVVLEDKDPTVHFDGPLVVMVNSFSASASEILAAAVQDYNRGIVIGSDTYGKGTVQQVFDLDRAMPAQYDALKPFGSLKLTTQKFYRINGDATQLKGVAPDITLPDLYTHLDLGEKEQDYPMPWSRIVPAQYKPWTGPAVPNVTQLRTKSSTRIAQSKDFASVQEEAKRLKQKSDDTVQPLKLTAFREKQKIAKVREERAEGVEEKDTSPLRVNAPRVDLTQAASDTTKVNRLQNFSKEVRKDIYINEAVAILKDQLQASGVVGTERR